MAEASASGRRTSCRADGFWTELAGAAGLDPLAVGMVLVMAGVERWAEWIGSKWGLAFSLGPESKPPVGLRQWIAQLRCDTSWAPWICWPALRAALMAPLSGAVAVVIRNHSGASSSSALISTASLRRLVSSW